MKPWHRFDRALFGLYGLWIAVGLVVGPLHLDDQAAARWPLPPFLIAFVDLCLRFGDPVLIALAAVNTHSVLVRFWGRRDARRWLGWVVAVTAAIETAGTVTGFPFGHYAYTENFGPRLWVLPIAIPLAWYVLIGNALVLWRSLFPGFITPLEAAGVATLVTGIDWVMEPFAARIKVYWLWSDPAIPLRNYLSWWGIVFLLVVCFAKSPGHQDRFDPRPPVILGTMLALFAITRWTYGV